MSFIEGFLNVLSVIFLLVLLIAWKRSFEIEKDNSTRIPVILIVMFVIDIIFKFPKEGMWIQLFAIVIVFILELIAMPYKVTIDNDIGKKLRQLIQLVLLVVFMGFYVEICCLDETVGKGNVEWDYSNYEMVSYKYEIMGIQEKEIIIKVSYGGEESLRMIALEDLKLKLDETILIPYVYRENYIYTEYDYSKDPPEALRKDSETWSDYMLFASTMQIQKLFGNKIIEYEQ